jgi:hypothetical protein
MAKHNPHLYFLVGGCILFIFFIIYGFWFDHKEPILFDTEWRSEFKKAGVPDPIIDGLAHDDTTWYYDDVSTCVAYGDWDDKCPRHENYCAGGMNIGDRYGQAREVYAALKNGGQHVKCPLIYPGAN